MDCKAVERAILEHGADVPEAVGEHVLACASCRDFSHLHQVLLEQPADVAPSPALEQAVLAAAHRRLQPGWRRLRPGRSWYGAAAAALLLLAAAGVWLRPHPGVAPQEIVRRDVPLATATRHWAGAQADLEVIEGGLDAAVAELGGMGAPARGADMDFGSQDLWDALTELEFDVYFESESLRQSGG